MKFYIITSGEYSDHTVRGLVVSTVTIDWAEQIALMETWANANIGETNLWGMSARQFMAMMRGVGLPLLECSEINITDYYNTDGDDSKTWRLEWREFDDSEEE